MADTNCSKIHELITSLASLKGELDDGMSKLAGNRIDDREKIDALWQLKRQIEDRFAELDPCKDWKRFKNGERILHYSGEIVDFWRPHPQGIVIENTDEEFLLNGETAIENGFAAFNDFIEPIKKQNRIHIEGDQFFLNGKLVYKGEFAGWRPHPQGLVIKSNDQLLLNGNKLLYEGKLTNWRPHPQGVIIHKRTSTGSDFYFYDHWPVDGDQLFSL